MSTQRKLTYTFQKIDTRDYTHKVLNSTTVITKKGISTTKAVKDLPASFITPFLSGVLDQGNLGACVANAAAFILQTYTKGKVNPSRLMLYDLSRIQENTPLSQDSGIFIRTACSALKKYGRCSEIICPYDINQSAYLPPVNALNKLNLFKDFTYYTVNQDVLSLKHVLLTNPIIFGIMVYDSLLSAETASTGIIPLPDITKETLQGGHCLSMVGYDDANAWFICINSWGTAWGNKGRCYLPYAYVIAPNLTSDFFYFTVSV